MTPIDLTFWLGLFRTLALETGGVVLAAALLSRLIRPAFWRRAIWQTALVCMLVLTVSELSGFGRGAAFILRSQPAPRQKSHPAFTVSRGEGVPLAPDTVPRPALPAPPMLIWWPAILWLSGCVFFLTRVAIAQLLFLLLRRKWRKIASGELNHRVAALLSQLGNRRDVLLLQATGLASPIAFGLVRPGIALPADFADGLTPAAQDAVLAHELAHLTAGDPLWYLLADAASALLWWNPFVWWARRQLQRHCELAADAAAALVPDGPVKLAECLVELGRRMSARRRSGLMGVSMAGFGSNLGERVESLVKLNDSASPPRRGKWFWVLKAGGTMLLAGMGVCVCGWISGPSDFNESWRQSPASAFLMAALDANQTTPEVRASIDKTSKKKIANKLEHIHFDEVGFKNLPLSDVVNYLMKESRKRSADGEGINFMLQPLPDGPAGSNTTAVDMSQVMIKIDPPLRNLHLRMVDVLDAITKVANVPIMYKIEDYAVVFSPRPPDTGPVLYTRVFKIDPNTFVRSLRDLKSLDLDLGSPTGSNSNTHSGLVFNPKNNGEDIDAMLRDYLKDAGVNLAPPKVAFLNDRLGEFMVRATLSDLDIIEQAVELLNETPPQLTLEVKFLEGDEGALKALGLPWGKAGLESTAILTDANYRTVLETLQQTDAIDILSAPKVVTLSGRQTHIACSNADENLSLDIMPTVSADGYSIQMVLIPAALEFQGYDKSGTAAPMPHYRVREVIKTCNIWDQQAVVLGVAPVKLPSGTNNKAKNVQRLILVTAAIIDPAGNLVHTEKELAKLPGIPVQPQP